MWYNKITDKEDEKQINSNLQMEVDIMNIRILLDNENIEIKEVKSHEIRIDMIQNTLFIVVYMNDNTTKYREFKLKDIVNIRTF